MKKFYALLLLLCLLVACDNSPQLFCDENGCQTYKPIGGLTLELDRTTLDLSPNESATVKVRLSTSENFGTLPPKDNYKLVVSNPGSMFINKSADVLARDEEAVTLTIQATSTAQAGQKIVTVTAYQKDVGYVQDTVSVTVRNPE